MANDLQPSCPVVIEMDRLEYVTFNPDSASYLFYICLSLFEVMSYEFNIFYSSDGGALDDDSDRWAIVEETDRILKGDYFATI